MELLLARLEMAEKRDATLATEVLDGLGLALTATLLLTRPGGFPLP